MTGTRHGDRGATRVREVPRAASHQRFARLRRWRETWAVGAWTREATALTVVVVLLVLLGLVMTFSASFVNAAEDGNPFAVFYRQLLWAVIGMTAFGAVVGLDARVWRRLAWPLLLICFALLALVLTPVGVTRFGAQSWLGLGPLSIQPSELAKLGLLVWLADVYDRTRPRDGSLHRTDQLVVPVAFAFGTIALLVMLQPDLGTAMVIGLVAASVLWVEGLSARIVGTLAVLGIGAVAVAASVATYRIARITGWLDPASDAAGTGYQLTQSYFALADGGVFGVGLGASRAKWKALPNADNDFIFAIIGEELGLVGTVAVVLLFVALLHLGLKVAYQAPDGFRRTVAASVTAWIVGQAFFNIGTVTGLLPITGITLPLVSAGGSSLVSTLVALGILVAIARRPGEVPVPAAARASGRGRDRP